MMQKSAYHEISCPSVGILDRVLLTQNQGACIPVSFPMHVDVLLKTLDQDSDFIALCNGGSTETFGHTAEDHKCAI